MSAASPTIDQWQDQRDERSRRELRSRLYASGIGHVLFCATLLVVPGSPPTPLPAVVSVQLLSALPSAAAPRPAPAPRPPTPEPPPAPAALPPPKPAKKVLPREPAPAAQKPKPTRPRRREPRKELAYDDALAELRSELGEAEPAPAEEALDAPAEPERGGQGVVDAELARWQAAVNAALGRHWVAPIEMRQSGLQVLLVVTVTADGRVMGSVVKRSSGDPYFDDNAQKALLMVGDLPPPPAPGDWPFLFDPTE